MLWRSQCADAWRSVAAVSASPRPSATPAASAMIALMASEAASSVMRASSMSLS
jgi:hypothetical protein